MGMLVDGEGSDADRVEHWTRVVETGTSEEEPPNRDFTPPNETHEKPRERKKAGESHGGRHEVGWPTA